MLQNCNVCGNTLTSYFSAVRDPLSSEIFAIYKCVSCGLGHTMPQPADLGHYYKKQYYGHRHGFTLRHCLKRRLGFVASAVGSGTGRRLLDIGCGDGSFLLAAKDAEWEVVGTELNPEPARLAGLDVKENIEQIPPSSQFDCITMWHTLEHMRDIPSMLAHIEVLLKPEGKLIIAVPNFGGLQARVFGAKWLHLDVPRHLFHFDAAALQHCLTSAGFLSERQFHQEFEYDLLGWSQSALNHLVPSSPNVFFDSLAGKQNNAGNFALVASFLIGSLLTLLSLPALVAGTVLGRGGTLIVVAGKSTNKEKIC
jgi:SAM-dependent methyltransferase